MSIVAKNCLDKLNEYRLEKKKCDVVLVVEGKSFYAHRLVLAAMSKYFEVMFEGDFAEGDQQEIKIESISAVGFEMLLDYVYTGSTKFDNVPLNDVLSVASYLNVPCLLEKCVEYILANEININTVLQYHLLADTLSIDRLKSHTGIYIQENFKEIAVSNKLKDIALPILKEFAKAYDDGIDNSNNSISDIFRKHGGLLEIVKNIPDTCFDEPDFRPIEVSIYLFGFHIFDHTNADIDVFRYDGSFIKQKKEMSVQFHNLYENTPKVAVCRSTPYMCFNDRFYRYQRGKWICLNFDDAPRVIHSTASADYDGTIYVNIESYKDYNIYLYKTELNKWCCIAQLGYVTISGDRIYMASLASYENNIFSSGGDRIHIGIGGVRLNDMLTLDNRAGKWIRNSYMLQPVSQPVSFVCNNRLYVSGNNIVQVYDIRADKWIKSMERKTNYDYLLTYRDKLYCYFGSMAELHVYDQSVDLWQFGPSCCQLEHKFVGAAVW